MATITIGNGNQVVDEGVLTGSTMISGNGHDVVTAGANSTIQGGDHGDNGKDTVTAGPHSTIRLGDGNNTVFAGSDSTITVGNGTAAIHAGTSDTITIGHGADLIKFDGFTPTFTLPATVTVDEEGSVALPITIGAPALGHEVINGFRSQQDVIALDTADFADYNTVKAASAQVGADTVITLDAGDTIT